MDIGLRHTQKTPQKDVGSQFPPTCLCVYVFVCMLAHTHMCAHKSLQGSEMVFCLKLIFKPFEFMLNAPQISAAVSANSSDLYLWVCQC